MPTYYTGPGAPMAPVFANPISSTAVATIASYLASGYWRETGGTPAKFAVQSGGALTVNLTGLAAEGRNLAIQALDSWTQVTGIRFVQVSSGGQITFDDNQSGAFSTSRKSGATLISSHVNVSTEWVRTYGADPAGYGLQTYVHEIGHALGIGHPGPYNSNAVYGQNNKFAEDSWQVTIMSYFSQSENRSSGASFAWVLTPQLADIRAMELLYGANAAAGAGNTTYGIGSNAGLVHQAIGQLMAGGRLVDPVSFTIHDRGGVDLLDLSTDTKAQVINLMGGTASTTFGLKGNMVIEAGTVIENLRAGKNSDALRGNGANNAIWGGTGNDTVEAGDGRDTVDGGAGNDALLGGAGEDRLIGGDGADWLSGEAGADVLAGGAGADTLIGGLGDDTLYGGEGVDLLDPGEGNDLVYGDAGAERIAGGAGNDRIHGGADADTLAGEAGDDLLDGGLAHDQLSGDSGNDTLWGGSGADLLNGDAGNDRLWGGADGDSLYGGDGLDILRGEQGNDALYGGAGEDTLWGGPGTDTLWGGMGADLFVMIADGGGRDVIVDFVSGLDRISLGPAPAGASAGTSQTRAPGAELHHSLTPEGVLVEYDLTGDGVSDISFVIMTTALLVASDFL